MKSLATQLREDGIDARLDQWHIGSRQIPSFMTSEVRNADFILAICTPRFREKIHATEDNEDVTGSGWEAQIAASIQFNDNRNRIIPLLASGAWKEAAPDMLAGLAYIDFSRDEVLEESYHDLLLKLLGKESKAPPLGIPPDIEGAAAVPLLKSNRRAAPEQDVGESTKKRLPRQRWPVWAFSIAIPLILFGYAGIRNVQAVNQFEQLSAVCQRQAITWCGANISGHSQWFRAQIKPVNRPDNEYRNILYVESAEKWQPHLTGASPIISPVPLGPATIKVSMSRRLPWIWSYRERKVECDVSAGEPSCPSL